jgi:hypothetical protein
MCEELFRDESVIRRLRQGPLGPYVDEFASDLQQQRYSMATIRNSVFAIDRFVQWLQNHNLGLEDAHEKNAERYRDMLDRYASGSPPTATRGLNHGIAFLRRKGIVKHQAPTAPLTPAERWFLRFDAILSGSAERPTALASNTIRSWRVSSTHVSAFPNPPGRYCPPTTSHPLFSGRPLRGVASDVRYPLSLCGPSCGSCFHRVWCAPA